MIRASYSRSALRSSPSLGVLLAIAALLSACGSPARAHRAEPSAATQDLVFRAQEAEGRRQYEEARSLYEQAIAEAPDAKSHAYAARELGSALSFWGEYQHAIDRLRESLHWDEKQPQVWNDLGILLARDGQDEPALLALERAVELAPNDPRPRISLAAHEVNLGKYVEARAQYELLLRMELPPKIESAIHKALEILAKELEKTGSTPAKAL